MRSSRLRSFVHRKTIVLQLAVSRLRGRILLDCLKLILEVIQEQRINHTMDILRSRVVHPLVMPNLRIQRGLENGSEDRGGNLTPVEICGHLIKDDRPNVVIELRNRDVHVLEECRRDEWKRLEVISLEGITLLWCSVEHSEELKHPVPKSCSIELTEIIDELILLEKPCILRIRTEDRPDTKHVQTLPGLLIDRQTTFLELLKKRIV